MITIDIDKTQIAKIKDKFEKYPPYAMNAGLQASSDYLNTPAFKFSMYPPESDAPFVWSSERQRRAYFATNGFGGGIPYSRTMNLMNSGTFRVESKYSSLYVFYENIANYFKWVQGNLLQIIGHRTRGWKPVNTFVVNESGKILPLFKDAALKAWDQEQFISGGGAGL